MVGNYVLRLAFMSCLGGFLLTAPLRAETLQTLDAVVVTGTRFPEIESENNRMVTVVTAEDMKSRGALNLFDGLSTFCGLAFKTQGPLGLSNGSMTSELSVRGLPGGELVLINGMPIQAAGGASYDLDTLALDQVDRVEILKGAASTLYGADAMTGAINIITRTPEEISLTTIKAESGEYGYQNYSLSHSSNNLLVDLTYQHLNDLHKVYEKTYLNPTSKSTPAHYDVGNTDRYGLNLSFSPTRDLTFDLIASYYRSGWQKIYDAGGKKRHRWTTGKPIHPAKIQTFQRSALRKGPLSAKGLFFPGNHQRRL